MKTIRYLNADDVRVDFENIRQMEIDSRAMSYWHRQNHLEKSRRDGMMIRFSIQYSRKGEESKTTKKCLLILLDYLR